MSRAIENLLAAQHIALKISPKVGGFPYLAEILRLAGVTFNVWTLPSCQAMYVTKDGPVMIMNTPLILGQCDVPSFNLEELVQALRTNQAGESSFPEFLQAAWQAGVVRYEVDFVKRIVTYQGCLGEQYTEEYPKVEVKVR